MRYPTEHKQETRERIVAAAAALFREQGVAATGVDAVMRAAGLTPGGFYAHFASKRALLAEAIATSATRTARIFEGLPDATDEAWLGAFVDRYLSARHRDEVARGCPLPALGPEIAAGPDDEARSAMIAGLENRVGRIAAHLEGRAPQRRRAALGILATLVGTVVLARIARGTPLADEVLAAGREQIGV